mmetsp:Transcript_123359/g.213876  ORF Transcript_123359/g.213876 Transcript_123359/m.213876 type:complete len:185 (+) Transcript_123359:639-1193(+)
MHSGDMVFLATRESWGQWAPEGKQGTGGAGYVRDMAHLARQPARHLDTRRQHGHTRSSKPLYLALRTTCGAVPNTYRGRSGGVMGTGRIIGAWGWTWVAENGPFLLFAGGDWTPKRSKSAGASIGADFRSHPGAPKKNAPTALYTDSSLGSMVLKGFLGGSFFFTPFFFIRPQKGLPGSCSPWD